MSLAPAPPEPYGLQRLVRQKNAGKITQTKTHHHNGSVALNTNLHTIDSIRTTSRQQRGTRVKMTQIQTPGLQMSAEKSTKSIIYRSTKEATVSTIS
jgi:hypothetical protein